MKRLLFFVGCVFAITPAVANLVSSGFVNQQLALKQDAFTTGTGLSLTEGTLSLSGDVLVNLAEGDYGLAIAARDSSAIIQDGIYNSIAIGNAFVTGRFGGTSIAIGNNVSAHETIQSMVMGALASVYADNSILIGNDSWIAPSASEGKIIAIGTYLQVQPHVSFSITMGDNINVGQEYVRPEYSLLLGWNGNLQGSRSIGLGKSVNVTGNDAIAIGSGASVSADRAIQLGAGTNEDQNTLSIGFDNVGNYRLLDSDGTIPSARLADNDDSASVGGVLQKTEDGMEWTTESVLVNLSAEDGGIAVGMNDLYDASAVAYSVAIGGDAHVSRGGSVAVGNNIDIVTESSVGIGDVVSVGGNHGVAIGNRVEIYDAAADAISIGYRSKAKKSNAIAIGNTAVAAAEASVQLGTGTNENAHTLQFENYKLLDSDGTIPSARIADNDASASVGQVLQKTATGMAWGTVSSSGGTELPPLSADCVGKKCALVYDDTVSPAQLKWEIVRP